MANETGRQPPRYPARSSSAQPRPEPTGPFRSLASSQTSSRGTWPRSQPAPTWCSRQPRPGRSGERTGDGERFPRLAEPASRSRSPPRMTSGTRRSPCIRAPHPKSIQAMLGHSSTTVTLTDTGTCSRASQRSSPRRSTPECAQTAVDQMSTVRGPAVSRPTASPLYLRFSVGAAGFEPATSCV